MKQLVNTVACTVVVAAACRAQEMGRSNRKAPEVMQDSEALLRTSMAAIALAPDGVTT